MNKLRMKSSSTIEVGDLVLGLTAESNFQATFGLIIATRELGGFYYVLKIGYAMYLYLLTFR